MKQIRDELRSSVASYRLRQITSVLRFNFFLFSDGDQLHCFAELSFKRFILNSFAYFSFYIFYNCELIDKFT